MRTTIFIILLLLAAVLLLPAGAEAEEPRIILYTCYRQMGWGDRVQAGWVNEKGELWLLTGDGMQMQWPEQAEEQISYLQTCREAERVGALTHDELFALKSLISGVEDQGSKTAPAACDAGTERSYALRYGRDGAREILLLGASGDDFFENTDPDAQALYLFLRQQFRQVWSYAGTEGMGPMGFIPVPVREFCGFGEVDLSEAAITAFYMDCEAGPEPLTLTEKKEKSLRELVARGSVTGKANAMDVTGGTVACSFWDAEGNRLASIELYQGLLVRPDGMYTVEQ